MVTDLTKIAFGISELLTQNYPAISFHVIKGLQVADMEEVASVGIISDRFHIIVTDDHIQLSLIKLNKPFYIAEYNAYMDVGFLKRRNHIFELPDPNAIDKLLQCINTILKVDADAKASQD